MIKFAKQRIDYKLIQEQMLKEVESEAKKDYESKKEYLPERR